MLKDVDYTYKLIDQDDAGVSYKYYFAIVSLRGVDKGEEIAQVTVDHHGLIVITPADRERCDEVLWYGAIQGVIMGDALMNRIDELYHRYYTFGRPKS